MVEDETTPIDKLQQALDHERRSSDLVDEAKDEVRELIADVLDVDPALVSIRARPGSDAIGITYRRSDLHGDLLDVLPDGMGASVPELTFAVGDVNELDGADRIQNVKQLVKKIEDQYDDGAPVEQVKAEASLIGMGVGEAEEELEKLRRQGEVYEPRQDRLRST